MKLYLIQHGEAVNKDVNPDRPLTDKGHNDIKNISEFLKQANIHLGQIYHSGKLRAEQTAEYFVKNFSAATSSTSSSAISAIATRKVQINKHINPNDELQSLVELLEQWDEDTLIVGHLPYLNRMVSYLISGTEEQIINYQPGTIVCLERTKLAIKKVQSKSVQGDTNWKLNWMVRPELLVN